MPALLAGHRDHAALRLEDEIQRGAVAIGAVLTESRHRAVDDAGIALASLLVGEPQPLQRAGPVVLEHDVRALHQVEEERSFLRVLEIHLDALLVAVQAHEIRGLAAGQGVPQAARCRLAPLGSS